MILIDPPSPFDTKSAWKRFREEMLKLQKEDPDNEDLAEAIALADQTLKDMK